MVLTDFGLCKEDVEPEGTTSTFCGTPEVSEKIHISIFYDMSTYNILYMIHDEGLDC